MEAPSLKCNRKEASRETGRSERHERPFENFLLPSKMAPTMKRKELPRPRSYDNNFAFLKSLTEKKKKKTECFLMKENDLQVKMDYETKMKEGTTKLLAACKYPAQNLEAVKSLITSNERMASYTAELQRRKLTEKSQVNPVLAEPSVAKVSISDIRMPLIWKDTDHFKNKGDYRRFTVFCLLKIGTEIYDTAMVTNIDRSMTDITFNDINIFDHVPHDFELRIEIYSHILNDDLSIASTPRKIKNRISSSLSRTLGRKLAAALRQEVNTEEICTQFDLIGTATLRLEDAGNDIETHDLIKVTISDLQRQLPLYGHFCCRLAVQVDCTVNDKYSGHLSLVQQVGQISGRRRLWCRLRNFELSFWSRPEESESQTALLVIPVDKTTSVESVPVPNQLHSFQVANKKVEHILVADSESSYKCWLANIKQQIQDHENWGLAATSAMTIPTSPGFVSSPMTYHLSGSALYEQTSISEIFDKPSSTGVLQDCGNRHSPPFLRSRSCSTSSATSSMAASRKPFSFLKFRKSTKN